MNNNLIEALSHYTSTPADRVPEIPLYMDQVLSYLESTLEPLKRDEKEPCLTKTMLNNYVKAGLIKPPTKKKYDQNHLMTITMLYRLKSTLQMKDIEKFLSSIGKTETYAYYERYLATELKVNARIKDRLDTLDLSDKDHVIEAILELAIEADAQRRLVEALIDRL